MRGTNLRRRSRFNPASGKHSSRPARAARSDIDDRLADLSSRLCDTAHTWVPHCPGKLVIIVMLAPFSKLYSEGLSSIRSAHRASRPSSESCEGDGIMTNQSERTMEDWMDTLTTPRDDSVPAGVPRAP